MYDILGVELLRQLELKRIEKKDVIILLIYLFLTMLMAAPILTPAASIRTCEFQSRSTADNLHVPYINCDLFKQSFEYRGLALWNSFPSHLRKAPMCQRF